METTNNEVEMVSINGDLLALGQMSVDALVMLHGDCEQRAEQAIDERDIVAGYIERRFDESGAA